MRKLYEIIRKQQFALLIIIRMKKMSKKKKEKKRKQLNSINFEYISKCIAETTEKMTLNYIEKLDTRRTVWVERRA